MPARSGMMPHCRRLLRFSFDATDILGPKLFRGVLETLEWILDARFELQLVPNWMESSVVLLLRKKGRKQTDSSTSGASPPPTGPKIYTFICYV